MMPEEGMDIETVRGSFESGALSDKSGVLPGCGWIVSAVALAGAVMLSSRLRATV